MAKEALKVLVRLLPPEITEDELVASVPSAHLEHTTWRNFQAGKRYKGEAKASINARCYFLFDSEENAEKFIKEYHGHQFVDGQGENFRAVACFAPYAKASDLPTIHRFYDTIFRLFVRCLARKPARISEMAQFLRMPSTNSLWKALQLQRPLRRHRILWRTFSQRMQRILHS
eukprot:symbB.v1.2.013681.t1/scaffold971.1/size148033/9